MLSVVMDQSESAKLPLWRLESTVLSPYTAPTAGLASASAASSQLRLKITNIFLILFSQYAHEQSHGVEAVGEGVVVLLGRTA